MQTWYANNIIVKQQAEDRQREARMVRMARLAAGQEPVAITRLRPRRAVRRFSVRVAGVCLTVVLAHGTRTAAPAGR
jgi:hypothetical protein